MHNAIHNKIFLVGDTKCDFKNNKNANVKRLRQLYSEYHLEQVITDYTRIAITSTENQRKIASKSLLDHFSTNRAKYIKRSGILELGMVGHFLIFAVRKVNAWRQKTGHRNVIETRNLRKYNKQKFLADLRQIDWISILDPLSNDPDKMASTFHEIFESLLEIHAPLKKRLRMRNQSAP